MDTSGPAKNSGKSFSHRQFFQWAVKWFYTDYLEETAVKPDAPVLASLLQGIGFQLREFDKKESSIKDHKPKINTLRVIIECETSQMRAVLELDDVKCRCPNSKDTKDAAFWSVSGTGPTGSTDSINKIEESGCNLLPKVPKDVMTISRDVVYRLFKMMDKHCSADAKEESTLSLNSLEPKESVARSYTQPEIKSHNHGSSSTTGTEFGKMMEPTLSARTASFNSDLSKSSLQDLSFGNADAKTTSATAFSPALDRKPSLQRQKTWDIDVETGSAEGEPRPSPPKISSTPVVLNQLCTSLGQISMTSDEEASLAELLIKAQQNVTRALKMLLEKEQDVFAKPATPSQSSSFRRINSPRIDSRPGSSCSIPGRSPARNTVIQKPFVRRISMGSMGPSFPRTSSTEKNSSMTGSTSKGYSRRRSSIGSPMMTLPPSGNKDSRSLKSSHLDSRIIVTAKRRVSPDPESNPSQMQKSSTASSSMQSIASTVSKSAPRSQKTSANGSSKIPTGSVGKCPLRKDKIDRRHEADGSNVLPRTIARRLRSARRPKMAEEINDVKSAGPSSPRSPQSSVGVKPSSSHSPRQLRRVKLTDQQLDSFTKDELAAKWREQDLYVECLEAQATAQEGELASLRESEDKYRQQYAEASHREKILVRRLASKEQELQEYVSQISEMKAAHAPSAAALRSALLDPAVNILIQKLRQELVTTKAKLEDTQNELSAWKFTPDSNTGKRLMAKCRLLYQENEELGRMIASGRIAKLEGELALQKSFSEEVKKSQSELDEFLQDLDEDVEGMQSTIYFLQQELRKARESVTLLQQENAALKSNTSENNLTNGLSPHTPPIKKEESDETAAVEVKSTIIKMEDSDVCKGARTPPLPPEGSPRNDRESVERTERTERRPSQPDHVDESSSDSAALIIKVENEELSDREEEEEEEEQENRSNKRTLRTKTNNRNSGKANGEEVLMRTTRGRDRTKRDKSASGSDDERSHKKKRRESVLSLDYNEADDDALVLTNGETLQSDPE